MNRFAAFVLAVAALSPAGCENAARQSAPAPTANVPEGAPAPTPSAPTQNAPSQPSPSAAPAAAHPATPAGPTQSITGSVAFTGTAPPPAKLEGNADPFCASKPLVDETLLVNANKTLRNVVVRLVGPLPDALPPPPSTPLVMNQEGCLYRPRVQAAVAGQTIVIKNSDQTLHNVHTYRSGSTLFNFVQVAGAPPVEKVVRDDATFLKFTCDVHPWMVGWVSVTKHPWVAVTGDDGRFEIKDVPPGSYKLEAWHEKLGTKTAFVTVANKTATAELAFSGMEK